MPHELDDLALALRQAQDNCDADDAARLIRQARPRQLQVSSSPRRRRAPEMPVALFRKIPPTPEHILGRRTVGKWSPWEVTAAATSSETISQGYPDGTGEARRDVRIAVCVDEVTLASSHPACIA
jgi:hypothetical protein